MLTLSTPRTKALLFDLSGVLYIDNTPLPNAQQQIHLARQHGFTLRFVTNTASQSSAMILEQLNAMGFQCEADELFTAPRAAKAYLLENQLRPFCLIHPNLEAEFDDLIQAHPNCVLLGDAKENLNYTQLNHAFQLIQQGYPLIGIGKNKYYQSQNGLMLDAGAFIEALEWASGTEAIITGKPDAAFYQQVVASTGYEAHECLMIGDDVVSDVKGAFQAGLQTCLVRTGKYQPSDDAELPPPAHLIDSIADLRF